MGFVIICQGFLTKRRIQNLLNNAHQLPQDHYFLSIKSQEFLSYLKGKVLSWSWMSDVLMSWFLSHVKTPPILPKITFLFLILFFFTILLLSRMRFL
jgi:hypothetical protein